MANNQDKTTNGFHAPKKVAIIGAGVTGLLVAQGLIRVSDTLSASPKACVIMLTASYRKDSRSWFTRDMTTSTTSVRLLSP